MLLLLILSLPVTQRALTKQVSTLLSNELKTRVSIDGLHLSLNSRIVLDGVKVYDKRDSVALGASRVAAKLALLPLAKGQIVLNSAQLLTATVNIYKDSATAPLNIQPIIEALSSKDSTSESSIDLQINQVILRHCKVNYDQLDAPQTTGRFNAKHLHVKNINLTAELRRLTPEMIDLSIRRLEAEEECGLSLRQFNIDLSANSNELIASDIVIQLSNSTLSIPRLTANYPEFPSKAYPFDKWIENLTAQGNIMAELQPSDASPFIPALQKFNDKLSLRTQLSASHDTLHISDIKFYDEGKHVNLTAEVTATPLHSNTMATCDLRSLTTNNELRSFLQKNLDLQLPEWMDEIGSTLTDADIIYSNDYAKADLHTQTDVGRINIYATLQENQHLKTDYKIDYLKPAQLFRSASLPQLASLNGTAAYDIKNKSGQAEATIYELTYKNHSFNNIRLNGQTNDGNTSLQLSSTHPLADFDLKTNIGKQSETLHLMVDADIRNLNPYACGLTSKFEGESFSGKVNADIQMLDIDHISGEVKADELCINSITDESYQIGTLNITSSHDREGKHISLQSMPVQAAIDGQFAWNELAPSVQQILYTYLPGFIDKPTQQRQKGELTMELSVKDTTLIERLASLDLKFPQRADVYAQMDANLHLLNVKANVPEAYYGNEHLRNVMLRAQTTEDILHAELSGERLTKGSTIHFQSQSFANQRQIRSELQWRDPSQDDQHGRLCINGTPYKDKRGKQAVRAVIDPSEIVIKDATWVVNEATIDYHDEQLDINNLGAQSGERYLRVAGTASNNSSDELSANLNEIDISYILGLVNFHSVEFDGNASGRVLATSVFKEPHADAYLQISGFTFNEASLGTMDVYGNYGDHDKSIYLKANIQDPPVNQRTTITGTITPGRGEGTGLDLHVHTQRFNLGFINSFTRGIMSNVVGRASGYTRIFGPFKGIDLEGDMFIDEASLHIDVLNTDYSLYGDSVTLRPGSITLNKAQLYDSFGAKGQAEHNASLTGGLFHKHLGKMSYDMQVQTNNFLSYNHPTLNADSYCGVAYTTGNVHIWGASGYLNVDVAVTPMSGSELTYNATQPDKITEANFIRYVKPTTEKDTTDENKEEEEEQSSDMRLNFDLNITPEATLKVLMDNRSGDNITIAGNGHMRASYYNKGKFQLYGTYHVEEGLYDMSIQDFLHKEFKFQPGSTIIFGGNATQAALNLRAAYTVPNVSLDDLSTTSLGLSNTRVDCIMSITGQPFAPQVTFDFELPNASDEEKQMVRSIVSTEEERNSQVIYLLGIGRFFNFDGTADPNTSQSQTAVNSLLSSTLSSQFNRALSNAIGASNWNFGTNVRTSQVGWNNVDVEGMLSGRLLKNRLLINGNFGYRERYYSTRNFVGDFDVQYLITPSGSIALKAYNKSNDRYFIQSSLNTQGIGIQFKKDFRRFADMFRRKKKK